jgi:hypothetical protein
LAVSHPLRYIGREVAGTLASRVARMQGRGTGRMCDVATA